MQTDLNEYIPTTEKKRIFNLTPATDEISLVAIQARLHCLRDHNLSYGARCLFAFLLDSSLNPYVNCGKGIVAVSATRIAENLGCYENTIFRWLEQLERGRHIWKDKQFMPNFWAMNRYHITALDAPEAPAQLPTRDGQWGNGTRRPEAPKRDGFTPPLSKTTAQNGGDFLQPVENECSGKSETTADASQKPLPRAVEKPRRGAVEKPRAGHVEKPRAGHVEKPRRTAGKNHGGQVAETTDIRETQVTLEKEVSKSQSISQTSRGDRRAETDFLTRVGRFIGADKFKRFGGQWTARFREDPKKAWAVLADATASKREGAVHSSSGGFMDALWRSNFGEKREAVGK